MKIGIIGTGRVGPALGKVFLEKGLNVSGIWGRNPEKAREASGFIGCSFFYDLSDLLEKSDIVFIAISDDAIGYMANRIADTPIDIAGKIFAHTSGSLPSTILDPLRKKGSFISSFHPLQSFGSRESGVELVKKSYIAIEGDMDAVDVLRDIARKIGAYPFSINTESKVLYHASAVMACNLLYGLYFLATKLLSLCGVDEEVRDKVLIPLVEGTFENIKKVGPLKALTGPVSRGDIGTLKEHLEAMKREGLEEHMEVYKVLGSVLVEMARKRGLSADICERMKSILME